MAEFSQLWSILAGTGPFDFTYAAMDYSFLSKVSKPI
jgi:hypothetical protein